MEEQKLEDLYQFVPKGMFSNKEELQSFINTDGLNSVYQLIPKGMFSDENSFVSAFASQKKKPSSAGGKVGTMGSTGQPTQEKDILSELQFDKETYTPIKSKLPAPTKGTGLVGEDAPKGYVETPPAPKIQPTKPVAPTTDMPDYGNQYRDIADKKVAIKQLQIKRAEDVLALDTKDAKDLGFSLDEYRQLEIKKYADEFLTGPQQNQYNIENRINSLTELAKGLDPIKDINNPLFKGIEKLQRERDASKQEMVNGVLARVDQLKSELPGLTGDAKREKAEEIKKLYASITPVIAPAAYAKEKADTPEVRTMPGDTPMAKLKNYYRSITNEYEETLKLYQEENKFISGIKAYTDPSQTRKLARLQQEIKELTPIVTINQKELKEDNWLTQLAKGAIVTLIDSDIITTEQEQATKLYDSFKKADISSNISKENIAALNESMRMTTGEEVSSTLGVTLGMLPSFMGGGMAVKGVGKLSKLTKGGTRAAGAFDNLSKSSKAAKFLLGATETGLSYEAAGLLSSSQSVEDEASFISGFMGETFVGALGKLVPKKLYNQTMLKLFGGSANKAQDIFMKGLAQVGSKAGYGFGEVAEEYGNEIGNIISESNGDLNEFMKLHSERFGKLDENIKFGLMTFGMGMAFGAFTKSGKQFMEKHQEWLSEQSPEVQSEFATIAAETQAAIEPIEKIADLEAEAEAIVDEESPRLQEIEAEIAQIEALTDEDKALEAALVEEGTLPDAVGAKPTPNKVTVLGKEVNMYNEYIPSKTEDIESDAMYSFSADSKEGIPPLLQDVSYSNTTELNGVKTEKWNASISGDELLKLYPATATEQAPTPQATEKVADVADVAKKAEIKKINDELEQSIKETPKAEQSIEKKAAKPTPKATKKKASKEVKAATLEIEDRRKKELSERVVYDKAPTAEDGEFKLAGVPGDTIFRINKETGKPQTLNKTTGNFTNVTTPAKVFFDGTKKSGFEKTKESINARYDAEITALTTPATTEVATEAKVQEETKPAPAKVPTLKGSALFNAARSIKADAKKSIENTASDLEKISEYLKQIYQEYKAADTEYKKTRIRNIQKEVTLQKEAISKDLESKKEAKIKEEKAKIEKSLQSKRDTRMEVAADKESKAKVDKLFSGTDKTVSEKLAGNLVRNKSGNTRTSLDSKKIIEFAGIDMYMRLMNKVNSLIQAGDSYSKIKAAIVSELNQDATFKNETQEKQFDLIKAATALVNTAVYFDRAERAYTIDEKVKNREKTVGGLKDLKLSIVNIIKASIPKYSTKSKSLIEKLSKQVNSYTESNVEAKSKKLIDDIVKAREAIMKDVVKKITSTIQSSTDESIKAMQPLLELALDGNMNKIEELVEGLSDKIKDIKKKRYAELKKSEKALLGLDYAFANISNITSMSLEEAISLFDNLKGLNSNKIYKINSVRDFNNFIKNKINEDAQSQIAETNPELFDANGVPLNSDEINLTKMESVRQRFKDSGIGAALTQFKEKIKSGSLGSLMKQSMDWRNLDTIVNILDRATRGKDFFDRMVARPLKRANTEKLRGQQSALDRVDKIANDNGFESFDEFERKTKRGEIKGIKIKFGTAGDTKTAKISYEEAQRIYALSLNTVQRKKILDVISEAELKKIEDTLSENERGFIKGVLEFLSNEYYKGIDSVKYATEGVHLGFVEMYFPTSTMSEAASEMSIEQAYSTGEIKLMESKYHKARTDKKSTIKLFDKSKTNGFSEILRDYIDKMEHYKAYAYTTKEIHDAINAPASKALLHAIGVAEPFRSKINFAINGSQAAYSKNPISEFLQSRLADIVLSWKPIQFIKQASSIFGAFSKFNINKEGKRNTGNTIKDLFEFGYKAGWYGMQASLEMVGIPIKNGPVARAREMSPDFRKRYDRHKSGEAFISALESGGQLIKKKRIDKTRWQRFLSKVIKSKKFFTAAGDIVGVIGYMVNYDKDLENNVPMSKAQEDFADYNATQQSERVVDMIGIQQTSNWATKIFTQFLSSSFLYMNNFARNSRNIRKDLIESVTLSFNGKFKESYEARPKIQDIRGFVLYGGLLNALFQMISYFSKLISDDDDDVKDAQKHILEGMSGLSLVYSFPIVGALAEQIDLAGRAISAANGDDYVAQRRSADLGVNPVQRFLNLFSDFREKETQEQAKAAARIFVQLGTGTPTAQFETLYNIYENHGYVEPEDTYELMGISKSYIPKEAKPESEYEEKKMNLLFLGERKYKEMYGEDDDLKQFKKEEKELLE